jgi:hypothetical protein
MYVAFILLLATVSSIVSQETSIPPAKRNVMWRDFKVIYNIHIYNGENKNFLNINCYFYQTQFKKTYASAADESARMAIFNERLSEIIAHNNNPSSTYQMAINQFTDMVISLPHPRHCFSIVYITPKLITFLIYISYT